jgi:hypothetical protein
MLKDKFNQIRLFHIISIKYVRSSNELIMIGSQVLEFEMVECMLNSSHQVVVQSIKTFIMP